MTADFRHGGAIDLMRAQFPNAPKPWMDLSTGINPWPYPNTNTPKDAVTHLPSQSQYEACRTAMAASIDISPDRLALAPGSELLIRLLPTILRPRAVAILAPTYGDHADVWHASGAQVTETDDPLSMENQVDMIVLCRPNNPDGRLFKRDRMEAARVHLASKSGWLVIDEAYADLLPSQQSMAGGDLGGLIVLRSFGKFFGLAGLRLGGMIAPHHILHTMRERLGAWPVSGAALGIGERAYTDRDWQDETRRKLTQARIELDRVLTGSGLTVSGGTDLFRFVETDGNAHDLWVNLAASGIYTRRFEWSRTHLRFGLPKSQIELDRLKTALTLSA